MAKKTRHSSNTYTMLTSFVKQSLLEVSSISLTIALVYHSVNGASEIAACQKAKPHTTRKQTAKYFDNDHMSKRDEIRI